MKTFIEAVKLYCLLAIGFFGLVACGGGGGGGSGGGTPADGTAPTVTAHSPLANATGVAVDTLVNATFSEAIDPLQANGSFNLIDDQGFSEPGALAYDEATRVGTFTPDSLLAEDTRYTATIGAELEDLAGNPLAGDFSWSFTTGPSPTLVLTEPEDEALEVPVEVAIRVGFSEAMDQASISQASLEVINLSDGGVAVAGSLNYDPASAIATFTPTDALFVDTTYQVTQRLGPTDLAGNPLAAEAVWTFTTETSFLPPPPPFP